MNRCLLHAPLTLAAICGLALQPVALSAQKALVYCPVGIDVTGCDNVVNALGSAFPEGVDRGYDGSSGTVDLMTTDLWAYAVFVVPSLADNSTRQPYAFLRATEVAERLSKALLGRYAFWSGTPDLGSGSRDQKDALLRNLAAWVGSGHETARGPGLVVLQDQSEDTGARYGWVKGITGIEVIADSALHVYSSVRALTSTAAAIVGDLAYENIASFGFQLPTGAAGVSLDAVGNTGTSTGGQVVLMTSPGANAGSARIWTDRDDYAPGETVTMTGSGFQPGETIILTLTEDPEVHEERTFAVTADESGSFVFTGFSPEAHDLHVRFILTAIGQSSGQRAQTTFTDSSNTLVTLFLQSIPNPDDPERKLFVASVYHVDPLTNAPTGGNVTCGGVYFEATNNATGSSRRFPAEGTVALNATGTAAFALDGGTLAAGSYAVMAFFLRSGGTTPCSSSVDSNFSLSETLIIGRPTAIQNLGPTSGVAGAAATLSATLVDQTISTGANGISGKTVSFTLNSQTYTATTGSDGVATTSVTLPAAGTYTLTASFAGGDPYAPSQGSTSLIVSVSRNLTISKAGAGSGTVTSNPVGINCGASCAASFADGTSVILTATAAGGSTFAGWSGAGTDNSDGTRTVSLTEDRSVTATFKAKPTFTFNLSSLPAKTYGDPPFSVLGGGASYVSTNSTGQITFALGAGSTGCTVTLDGQASITGAATGPRFCIIEASLAEDPNYTAAGPISQRFSIAKAVLTVTANDETVTYGDASPTFGVSYGTFVGSDDASSLGGTLSYSFAGISPTVYNASTTVPSNAGTYSITPGGLSSNNYSFDYVPGTFTINKATPSFSDLGSPSISFGSTATSLSGKVGAGTVYPVGSTVTITLNGTMQNATVQSDGTFSSSFATGSLPVGGSPYSITYQYGGDSNFHAISPDGTGTLTVTAATTTVMVATPASTQYSDPVTLSATVSPAALGGETQSGTMQFSINGVAVCGASPLPSCPATHTSGTFTLSGIRATQPAGSYSVTATFTSTNSNFSGGTGGPATLELTRERVGTVYTGDDWVATAGPSISTAPVRLGASLTQEADGNPGDITLAWVRFELFKGGNLGSTPDQVVGNVPVDASGNAVVTINLGVDDWTVKAKIEPANGYWTASPVGTSVVTVALGSTEQRVTGGGWIPTAASANGKANFGFTVSNQKNGNPRGNSIFVFRATDLSTPADQTVYDWVIKSNSWQGGGLSYLGNNTGRAMFSGKCVIQKIDPATGEVVGSSGNNTCTVEILDGDVPSPKVRDAYTIRIQNSSNSVWREFGSAGSPLGVGGGQILVKSR